MSGASEQVDVAIVGGGPAGLAHAFWLGRRDPGRRIVVLDRRDEAGGHVRSRVVEECVCEWGPQGIRPSPPFDSLVEALGCRSQLVDAAPSASTRWVARFGRLRRAPAGPGSFLVSPLLPFVDRMRAVREPWIEADADRADETLAAFVARRFGDGAVALADAMVGGIFAGSAHELEVRSAFPSLVTMEREHGSVLRAVAGRAKVQRERARAAGVRSLPKPPALQTLRGGMQTLVDLLAEHSEVRLGDAGHVVAMRRDMTRGWHLSLENGRAVRAAEVVLAAPANVAADLLRDLDPTLRLELAAIPMADVVSVHVRAQHEPDQKQQRGFGFLMAPGPERSPVLGAIYVSEVFPAHAPSDTSTYRVMLGGARAPGILDFDDGLLEAVAVDALRRYARVESSPRVVAMDRVRRAIPQYVAGHADRVVRIRERVAQLPGVTLIGNSYDGIALGDQLGDPTEAAAGSD